MTFKEWLASLTPPKDYTQSAGSDIADSIALAVIMGLLLLVVFM